MRKSDLMAKDLIITGRLKFHFADNGTETPNSFLVSMSLSFGQTPPPKQSRRNKAATYLRYERRRDFVLVCWESYQVIQAGGTGSISTETLQRCLVRRAKGNPGDVLHRSRGK